MDVKIGTQFQGGIYAGVMRGEWDHRDKAEAPDERLIVMEIMTGLGTWDDVLKWSGQFGSLRLPSLRELSLCHANIPEVLKGQWYWSNEAGIENPNCAWSMNAANGFQCVYPKAERLSAFIVRRVPLEFAVTSDPMSRFAYIQTR